MFWPSLCSSLLVIEKCFLQWSSLNDFILSPPIDTCMLQFVHLYGFHIILPHFSSSIEGFRYRRPEMTLQPFSDKQLNFFKLSSLVFDEFPKVLRQTFKTMWDNTHEGGPGFKSWDDSTAVRNLFASKEGGTTKVPIHQSYNEWDCTDLFRATIFASSFALPDSTGSFTTLSDLYVKPRALPHGSFHACVLSPGGNNAETFALAIDQLRRLRNSLCHPQNSEIDKATFDQHVNYAKDAFKALGVSTAQIDAIGSLTESDFPTKEVCRLKMRLEKETQAYINFLEEVSSDISEIKALLHSTKEEKKEDTKNTITGAQAEYATTLEGASSDIKVLKQMCVEDTASREVIARLEETINELKSGQYESDVPAGNSGMK